MYNREKRAVHANQMLEVKMINGKVRIHNFLPYEFTNVYLVAENTMRVLFVLLRLVVFQNFLGQNDAPTFLSKLVSHIKSKRKKLFTI